MPPSLSCVTPTLAALLGVEAPALSEGGPLPEVLDAARRRLGARRVSRCLVYCPDAIGAHLHTASPGDFAPLLARSDARVALHAVMPSVTPVCFASMFTGGAPEAHGIRQYAKPVLTCDTIFDAALRAGRRVAIVAVAGSSVATIFRGRALDYYEEVYDEAVIARTKALVEADQHTLIVAYVQAYDDTMHRTTPFSAEAMAACRSNLAGWQTLLDTVAVGWAAHDHVAWFAPDHGAHLDEALGHGEHGLDIPEDLLVYHYVQLGPGAPLA